MKNKNRLVHHIRKNIIVFLLVFSQLLLNIQSVEAYTEYAEGYNYTRIQGLLDGSKRVHELFLGSSNSHGTDSIMFHEIIFNKENELTYENSTYVGHLGQNRLNTIAMVPRDNDFTRMTIYSEIISNVNSSEIKGGLASLQIKWDGYRYVPDGEIRRIIYETDEGFVSWDGDWVRISNARVYVTNNGVIYKQWSNYGHSSMKILGVITEAGYQGFKTNNFECSAWYGYYHFSYNASGIVEYAYKPHPTEKNKYIKVSRTGVQTTHEGDMYRVLYKILDEDYYNDHGPAKLIESQLFQIVDLYDWSKNRHWFYNNILEVGGEVGTIYYNGFSRVSYIPNNKPPTLTINNPINNSIYVNDEGLSTINVNGSARDPDNDKLTVTATLGGVSKSATITNTSAAGGSPFNFTFDVGIDEITDGSHKLEVSVTDGKIKTPITLTRNIIVKGRVRHNGFVLVDSQLYYKLIYQDEESDPKIQEQFRYVHNPNHFKNSLGVISDSNTWRNTVYNSLSLPGHYKVTSKAKDNPKNLLTFDEYKMWSRESLSEINLYVHRKPIAIFKATVNTSGTVTVTNFTDSYDPDHQGEVNNGIRERQWRWRNVNSLTWINGSNPPTSLPIGEDYIIALRVRDIDGIDGIGVWGDWTEVSISTKIGVLAPLNALFTLNPNVVSHNPSKTITVTNLSSGPFTKSEWIIRKAGVQQGSIISTAVPTSAQLKQGGIGKYTLQLRVGDNNGRWSEPYTLPYEVINNPPIANFEAPDVVYRDTNISLINKTAADLDGDTITYQWKLKQPNGTEYNISTASSPIFKIQSFISSYSINPITAISKNWEIKLIATDAKGAKSEFTKDLEVINNIPEAKIIYEP